MGLGLGLGIQFKNSLGRALSEFLTWGQSIPARFWGTESPEYWGGIDAQAQVHYNRVIADGGVVPAGLGGVNSFFQVVKEVYGTTDINTAISAAYDAHYLGYKLGAGSGTTLGQAAQKLYAPKGIFGGIGTGSAFWEGVGVNGNFVSTPNAAANQITGDIDLIAFINMTTTSYRNILTKDDAASNRQFIFSINNTLQLGLNFGAGIVTYNSTINIPSGANVWIRATRNATNGEIRFFTSNDASTTNPQSVTWTQLGTTVSGSTGSTINGNSVLCVGAQSASGVNAVLGQIFRATIANSIGGTPVVDFNANQYTGANTWTSTTSEVWTVNSTGAGLADVTQTTAASQPLLLAHTGENYWFGSGVSGNYLSALTSASNITDDIEIGIYCDYLQKTNQSLGGKTNGGTYIFYLNSIGRPVFQALSNTLMAQSTVGVPISQGWLKASRKRGVSGFVKFFYSAQPSTTPIASINWIELSNVPETSNQPLTIDNVNVNFGAISNGVSLPSTGKIYRGWIANSIGGTPVVDFNPASYNPATSQTQWTSTTGEVWSLNTSLGTGTGYRGLLVDRSYVMSDGIDDAMVNTFTLATIKTIYNTYKIWDVTATGSLFASNNGAEVVDANLTGTGNCLQYDNAVNQITISLTGTGNRYTMRTAVINGANSLQQINNGTAATGTLGTSNSTSMKIFQERNGSFKSKMVFSSMFLSLSADNTTIRTAIYNYLRSINGNSF